jgi:CRP-like cAMP-binding protein
MMPRRKKAFDPIPFLARVHAGKTISSYERGEILYKQDEPADRVFCVEQGRVTLSIRAKGQEALLGILGPRDFFGIGGVNPSTRRVMTATALTDCKVIGLTTGAMTRLLRREPAFNELFVTFMVNRQIRIQENLADQLLNSSEKRLARALLVLTNFDRDGGKEPVLKGMSQVMLADMIGTTRPRVSHFMNKFRRLGYIQYNGDIRVHRSLRNVFLED